MKKLVALLLVGALLGGGFAYVRSSEPDWWVRLWYPLHYDAIVRGHARNYDLDPALLAAVIYQESKFHAHARSSSGAIGLMQLLPDTAKGIAVHTGGSRFRVGEDDVGDRAAVDLAGFVENALAEPVDQRLLHLLVLAEQPVDDLVARDRRGAVAPERGERLALPRSDAARDGDRERALHQSWPGLFGRRRKRAP